MEIKDIYDIYMKKLETRDLLPSILEDINELEQNEDVKRYIELKTILEDNKDLYQNTDNEVLKKLLKKQIISFNLPEYYTCYGRNLNGGVTKTGEYYLLPDDYVTSFFNRPIKVAKYRNYENPDDIVIIPMKEVEKFEKEHIITHLFEEDKDKEYYDSRYSVIVSEFRTIEDNKRLVKN